MRCASQKREKLRRTRMSHLGNRHDRAPAAGVSLPQVGHIVHSGRDAVTQARSARCSSGPRRSVDPTDVPAQAAGNRFPGTSLALASDPLQERVAS